MTATITVVLVDGDAYAPLLADTLDLPVCAATADTFVAEVANQSAAGARVIGLSAWPWLAHDDAHATLATTYPHYRGVGSWYGLPQLATLLADVLGPAVSADAHVLFTAPDPGADASAETLAFLPRLADEVTRNVQPKGRSIAWQGQSRQPSAVQALDALIDAHNVTRVVECPVVPAQGGDASLRAHAETRQVAFTAVDVGVASRAGMLAQVVRTVIANEWPDT